MLAAEGGRVPSKSVMLHLEGGVMPSEGGIQSSYGEYDAFGGRHFTF